MIYIRIDGESERGHLERLAILLIAQCFFIAVVSAQTIDWEDAGFSAFDTIVTGTVFESLDDVPATCEGGLSSCEVEVTVTHALLNNINGVGDPTNDMDCDWGGVDCVRFYADNQSMGDTGDADLRISMEGSGAPDAKNDIMRTCFDFSNPVRGLQFQILDVDDATWDDHVELFYAQGATTTPMLNRTDLINGAEFGSVTTGVDTNHVEPHCTAAADPRCNGGLGDLNSNADGWGTIQDPPAGNAGRFDDGGNVSIDFGTTALTGFCLDYWPGPASGNNYQQWIGVTDLSWTSTLPVNLDFVSSSKFGRKLSVDWSTSSESFNLGFNFWLKVDGEWEALNRNFVPSFAVDSSQPLNYSKAFRLPKHLRDATSFGISSVDITGKEEFYGPFEIGKEYGEQVLPEPIDWQDVAKQKEQRLTERGFVKRGTRWAKPRIWDKPATDGIARLFTDKAGMTRVTYEELLAAGVDFAGVPKRKIAITNLGEPVARHVGSSKWSATFGPGSFIDFYAGALDQELALYNAVNSFEISENHANARPAIPHGRRTLAAEENSVVLKRLDYEQDKAYLVFSGTGSPWLDESFGYASKPQLIKTFNLPADFVAEGDVLFDVTLQGAIDLPDVEFDNLASVSVGNNEFQAQWSGFDSKTLSFSVPASSLGAGENQLILKGILNERNFSVIVLDKFSVSYPSQAKVGSGSIRSIDPSLETLQLSENNQGRVWAYARDELGNLMRLRKKSIRSRNLETGKMEKSLLVSTSSDKSASYFVLNQEGFNKAKDIVSVASTISDSASTSLADLYVVASASFVTAELQNYIDAKIAKGINTVLVEYDDLVDQFGYGLQSPYVIRDYLNDKGALNGDVSVLLVGGHSYDYLDFTGAGSVSFIPTAYRASEFVQFSPTDNPISDLDGDGLSDVSIGRWPVRDMSQLESIISKTIAWDTGAGAALESSVLLIAENNNPSSGINFAAQLNDLAQANEAVVDGKAYWSAVERLYATDFNDQLSPATAHRAAVASALTAGQSLTVFNGHGSVTNWSLTSVLNVNGVKALEENNRPSVFVPLACYTTYYETTTNESLASQLLFKQNAGAVAMLGAVTLGDYVNNGRVFERVFHYMRTDGLSMGKALQKAKRYLGVDMVDEANLWSYLGDPTLRFNANYTPPVTDIPVSTSNTED